MADKSVSIDLIIKSSEAASSLKEVKQSLKDIKDEMIKAGEGTPAFNKLAAAAGQLKDKVDDANEAIKATNPNKFQALASFAASAAGGVSAVTGAMGLFGEQSEEVTKTLAKVQSAMALSQGLAGLSELPKAWNSLKAAMASTEIVQKLVTIGTRLWNAALLANPIGLIIAGVAALAAGVYLLVKAFNSSNEEQERQLKLTKDLNAASIEGAKNAAVERNNLEILYKTSTDQTKSLQERKDAQVELQKTYPLTFKNYSDEDFALGKAKIGFDNLTDSVLALATMKAKQSVLDKMAMEKEEFMVTKTAELTQAISDQTNARTTWGKVAGYTREENIREEIAAKEIEFNLNSKAIIAEVEGGKKKSKLAEDEKVASAQAAKDKTDAEAKAKANAEKNAADYKLRREEKAKSDKAEADDKAKIDEEYRLSNLTAEEKSFDDFYALQKKYYDNKNITKEEFEKRLAERQEEIDNNKLEAAIIAELKETLASIDNAQFEADEKIRINAEEKEKTQAKNKEAAKIAMDLAVTSIAGLQTLSDLAFASKLSKTKKGSKEEEEVMRKQFKANKALNLSTAIINAAQAQLSILAQYPKFDGGFAMVAAMVGAGITSLASIAKIAATQFDTTSAGGNEPPPASPPPNLNAAAATATSNSQPSTLLNPDGTVANQNTPTPAPIQVYVVESDITSTQTQVAVVQNQMNFQ
jgi:hypothetical protein